MISPKKLRTVSVVKDQVIRDALDTHARTINALIAGDLKDTAWHEIGTTGEPQYQNSWYNFGPPYATLAYRKDTSGYLHLKGRAYGGEANTVVFNLPLGYRPENTLVIASPMGSTGWIEVGANGDVKIITN